MNKENASLIMDAFFSATIEHRKDVIALMASLIRCILEHSPSQRIFCKRDSFCCVQMHKQHR
jgi:hypothetical protein